MEARFEFHIGGDAVILPASFWYLCAKSLPRDTLASSMEKGAYDSAYSFYVPLVLLFSCVLPLPLCRCMWTRTNHSIRTANRFASNVTNLAGMLSVIVSVLMIVLAEPLVRLVYAGFAGEQLALTVRLTRIMLIGLVFFVVAIVLSSVLNARGQFMAAQLTGFPLSLCSIAATVFFTGGGVVAVAWSTVLRHIADFDYAAVFCAAISVIRRILAHDRRIRFWFIWRCPPFCPCL